MADPGTPAKSDGEAAAAALRLQIALKVEAQTGRRYNRQRHIWWVALEEMKQASVSQKNLYLRCLLASSKIR